MKCATMDPRGHGTRNEQLTKCSMGPFLRRPSIWWRLSFTALLVPSLLCYAVLTVCKPELGLLRSNC